ncbi:TIM barrel protein [Agrobacterium tumefaciens]|nr:TIM barrel protein [Agrobacterium tumefaciens]
MRYTHFGLHAGDPAKGEKGISIFPERRTEFRESVFSALDYAEVVGIKMIHAMAGVLPPSKRSHYHWELLHRKLSLCCSGGKSRGIRIIVEPMSGSAVPDCFIATPDRAAHAIAETGGGDIGILLDLFTRRTLVWTLRSRLKSMAS